MRKAALAFLLCAGCDEASPVAEAHAPLEQPRLANASAPAKKPATAPKKKEPDKPRVYSKVRFLWIRPQIGSENWIGYLSLGDSVPIKAVAAPGKSERCDQWYKLDPVGYVCTGEDATVDPNDPLIVELVAHRANDSAWPYDYGESLGLPIFHDLPTGDRLAALAPDDKLTGNAPPKLLSFDLPTAGRPILHKIIPMSTVAYRGAFDHEGRSFLMTWDIGIVPKSRVKPYPRSKFHGVKLGAEHKLPIAFFRGSAKPQYRRTASGFETTGKEWPRLAWVELTGQKVDDYYETRDGKLWVAEEDAAIARQADELPAPLPKDGRRTWIDISILGGTLVAYEGEKAVYATLISPGRGGVPLPGVPTLDTASTPTGTYPIVGKFHTATMFSSSNSDIMHTEVMYTQNFSGPYALHGAYWHDDWGNKKSGGCVNLSPLDSHFMFHWTEPRVPEGWHGMKTQDFKPKTLVRLGR